MHRLFAPRTILPLAAGVGIIAVLLGYADVGQVVHAAERFQLSFLPLLLSLTVGYQGLRALQWWLLLREGEPPVSWRVAVMSYMGGELAKSLPGGQYAQTYVLRRAHGTPIAVSAAATTVILWLEVVVCLAVVAILGVGPWGWARLLAVAILAGIALIAVLVKRRAPRPYPVPDNGKHTPMQQGRAWLDRFAVSAAGLLRRETLAPAAALSAGYIAIGALSLWAITAALGVQGIGLAQALGVYTFALAANLLIVVPVDLGLTELSGLAVLVLFGVTRADAVAILLLQRALSGALTGTVALATLGLLREQVALALRGEPYQEQIAGHALARTHGTSRLTTPLQATLAEERCA